MFESADPWHRRAAGIRPRTIAVTLVAALGTALLTGCSDDPNRSGTDPTSQTPTPSPSTASPPASPSATDRESGPIVTIPHPNAALLRAARTDDAGLAGDALASGADVDTRDADDLDRTALLVAANHDSVEVARVLVAAGADLDALDDQHDTAWLVTGVTGSVEMGKVLLAGGPDLTIRNRYGGLSPIPASERGHADYVAWVVTTDVDINHRNDLGWTALLEAIVLGDGSATYQRIVRTLLAAGADPTTTDHQGRDARELAVQHGHPELVAILDRHAK